MAGPNARDDFGGFLKHYGIKGMRWGVRKKGDKGPAVEKRPKSADHVEAVALKKKRPSELSNAELKKLNERMNLEQNYQRLMAGNPSKYAQGLKTTQDILKTAGQAYNTYNSPLVKELRKSLTNLN